MLKITQQAENPEIVRVSLSGYFTGEYVPEVEKVLFQNGNESKKCSLDLINVTFVDRPRWNFSVLPTRGKSSSTIFLPGSSVGLNRKSGRAPALPSPAKGNGPKSQIEASLRHSFTKVTGKLRIHLCWAIRTNRTLTAIAKFPDLSPLAPAGAPGYGFPRMV
jgi:hypothetical protein